MPPPPPKNPGLSSYYITFYEMHWIYWEYSTGYGAAIIISGVIIIAIINIAIAHIVHQGAQVSSQRLLFVYICQSTGSIVKRILLDL